MTPPPRFLSGVIEGFYGPPWSPAERRALFQRLKEGGCNTYVYAPKDDLKHRARWREPYAPAEAETLRETFAAARARGLRIIEVPIEWHYRAESRLSMLRDGWEMLRELLRIWLRAVSGRYK